MAEAVASKLSKLNPFSKRAAKDDDDAGEEMDAAAVAGGGHGATTTIPKHELRVSPALRAFLADKAGDLVPSADDDGALSALLDKPHFRVPAAATDRSFPLPEYFVSSSHNTYLLAHQLYGASSVDAYTAALRAGSRCVEIDAWDGDADKDEPKVTHGYTLVSHIPFRHVCETIRDVVDHEAAIPPDAQGYHAAPIFLSLENHCGPHGQKRMVEIMKEVWGHRLLNQAISAEDLTQHVPLSQLGSKIVVIVEHHLPNEADSSDAASSSDSSSEDDEEKDARHKYKQKKKQEKQAPTIIIPELAELGVYAQSVKPADNSWFDPGDLVNGPHHHLINVSETGLASHLPASSTRVAAHNAKHLMRVYPKGTRISSQNLHPVPFWGIGAQICALNWQCFDASMQINEAMFSGTDGYVLKPAALRSGGGGGGEVGRKKKLRLHVAGASNVPAPADADPKDIRPYLTCVLVHPGDLKNQPPKRKTGAYKQHKLAFMHKGENPAPTDPVWDEVLEWEYDDNELVFLRMLIKSDDSMSKNPMLAVTALRLMYAVDGWCFIRMLDLKGRETACSLLVKVELHDT
jgi:phosphatidylinositol phospholipase C, delta